MHIRLPELLADKDEFYFGKKTANLPGRFYTVEQRHGYVKDDQVGLQLPGLTDEDSSILGQAEEFEIGFKQLAQAFPDKQMVIRNKDSWSGHNVLRHRKRLVGRRVVESEMRLQPTAKRAPVCVAHAS
jgi:hypothetical protein